MSHYSFEENLFFIVKNLFYFTIPWPKKAEENRFTILGSWNRPGSNPSPFVQQQNMESHRPRHTQLLRGAKY